MTHSRKNSNAYARAAAFTLVELLLVMFVLAVLVSLVVGVGTFMIEDGKKKETEVMQANLTCALTEYERINSRYPPDRVTNLAANDYNYSPTLPYKADESPKLLYAYLTGSKGDNGALVAAATKPYLTNAGMTDAFGKSMRYYLLGATATSNQPVGGKPLVVSAGPDADFGDTNTKKLKDNIRSDGRASQ